MSNHVTREDIQEEERSELLERKEKIRVEIKWRYDLYKAGKDRYTQAEARGFKTALDIVETKWDEPWNWVDAMEEAASEAEGTAHEILEIKHALFISQKIVERYDLLQST
jgi:hypothetical protein